MPIRIRKPRWFLLFWIATASPVAAETSFLRTDLIVDVDPYAVIAGDFNGDGHSDVAIAAGQGLYTVLNEGGANFSQPVRTEVPAGAFWLSEAADFNGDGRDDLVGSGFVYLSRGDGGFLPRKRLGFQEAVAAADINHDGKTDLLVANRDQGVYVLIGRGDGSFELGPVVTSTKMIQVRVADFNGDALTDVATVLLETGTMNTLPRVYLLIFPGQADGTFGVETRTEIRGVGVLVADFNSDGLPDVATSYGQTVDVLLGNGDGTFQPALSTSNLDGAAVAAADFTGDGLVDLVVGGGNALYPGNGDGTFDQPLQLPVRASYPVAVADLDRDTRLDLVVLAGRTGVSILLARAGDGPELRRAVSAASYRALVAPGSLATLFMPVPVAEVEAADPPWPTGLGDLSLEIRDRAGAKHLAPLLFVSPTQMNFRVPSEVALGEATLNLVTESRTILAGSIHVDAVAPAIFEAGGAPAVTGATLQPDGSMIAFEVLRCQPASGCWASIPASIDRPIYLSFYGTGFHGADVKNVTCHVRNDSFMSAHAIEVPVTYAGDQQIPGVDQINVVLQPEVLQMLYAPPTSWSWFFGGEFLEFLLRIDAVPADLVAISFGE